MPKLFDRIILDIIIVLTTLMWAGYLIKNTALVIIVTVVVYLILKLTYLFLYVRYKNLKTMPVGEMEFLFAVKTPDEQAKHLLKTLPDNAVYFKENNYFCIRFNGQKVLFFCFYKFAAISNEDVARAYRTAKDKKVYNVYFIGKPPTRQTMLLSARLGLQSKFVSAIKLKKYLIKHNAMPEHIERKRVKRVKQPFFTVLAAIFHPARAKYFAFTGTILAFMTIFTPLKLYYIILSSVAFTVAAVSVLLKRFYD